MRNVVLARVDDRLIHGEVVSVWTPSLNANCILVVDDGVAADQFNCRVLKSLAPTGVKVFVTTVEKAKASLMKEGRPGEKIIVLAKTPITFDVLVDAVLGIRRERLVHATDDVIDGLSHTADPHVSLPSCLDAV